MWMKVDDRLHSHRKTRSVTRSNLSKSRDVAPMGLWIVAGSWAAQNATEGWVPEDELDRWDDDWKSLAARLVEAGYWWREERHGDPGYGFHDWHDYNDPADLASKLGTFGNHVRWHVNQATVDPECEHCPKEPDPDEPEHSVAPRSGGESGAISGGESPKPSGPIALPVPEPVPNPIPEPDPNSSWPTDVDRPIDRPDITLDRFQEFWDVFGNKVKRKDAERRWRIALKKPGVTPDLLIAAAGEYVIWERAYNEGGRYIAHPSTWLNGERWTDERVARAKPQTRVQEHLALVRQLAEAEGNPTQPQIGQHR